MDSEIIVIGAGVGGMAVATQSAKLGRKVTLIEKDQLGGTCLNRGCIPTKSLLACAKLLHQIKKASAFGIEISSFSTNLEKMIDRKNKVVATLRSGLASEVKEHTINYLKGTAFIKDKGVVQVDTDGKSEEVRGEKIVIATGSKPLKLWQGDGIITSDEALDLTYVPADMLVVGGGAVGIELGCFYAELGTKVTIVEMLANILPLFDPEISKIKTRELKKRKIRILNNIKIEEIQGRKVRFSDGKNEEFSCILSAVGRFADTEGIGLENIGLELVKGKIPVNEKMETKVAGVYAVGDVTEGSLLLAHAATAQGMTAAFSIAGITHPYKKEFVPSCIYSYPEVASVGFLEKDLADPIVKTSLYRLLGKAHADDEITGMIKIVADNNRKIKGVHIIGNHATDLIHEGLVAIKTGLTLEQLSQMIHAHPTYSECYYEALNR